MRSLGYETLFYGPQEEAEYEADEEVECPLEYPMYDYDSPSDLD
jgi:hypothetical protein